MKIEEITDNIIMIFIGKLDSNVYVVDDELVIDTTTGLLHGQLLGLMKKAGVDAKKVERIVNTHLHFDHIGGNFIFEKALVGMHFKDAELLKKNKEATYYHFFGGEIKRDSVDFLLQDGDRIKTANHKFVVVHTPGHTPGSICLYEPDKKILISGDTLFHHAIGRTDLMGGSDEDMLRSLEKILSLEFEMLFPGHGRAITRDAKRKILECVRAYEACERSS